MTEIATLPARSEVPSEQTWDLESVFASPADWEAACQQLSDMLPKLADFKGRLALGPQIILEYLKLAQEAGILAGMIRTYAFNQSAVDTTDQEAVARLRRSSTPAPRYFSAAALFHPGVIGVG